MSRATSLVSIWLAAATALLAADAAGTITGRVTDPQGSGIRNAVVMLYVRDGSSRIAATSGASGAFRFERIAGGEYLIEARSPGFAASAPRVVKLDRDGSTTLEIALELAGIRDVVVVTASGTAQAPDEVSKSVTVVTDRQLDERDEYSIAEALRLVPGLRVQQLGGPGGFTTIKTRGLRNEDTSVLVDGLRFREVGSPQGDASGFLADLLVTDLDRLEVLRGSGSSLYGTNAIGGVVNLVTGEGGGRNRGSVLAEGGALGLFRTRARASGGFRQDRIAYSAGLAHLEVGSGVDGDDPARNTSGQGRLAFRLSPATTLSGRIYTGRSRLGLNTGPQAIGALPASGIVPGVPLDEAELARYESGIPISQLKVGAATFVPSANDPDWRRQGHFFTGAVVLESRPAPSFGTTIRYQGLDTFRAFINGSKGISFQPAGSTRSESIGHVHNLDARVNARLGRHQLLDAGWEFENQTYRNVSLAATPAASSGVDVTERSNALFVQDQVRLAGNRLQISTAFRVQLFSLRRPTFTPASGSPYARFTFDAPPNAYTGDGSIAYFFRSSGTKLRAHVGNGYRAPSLYERFGTFYSSFGYSVYGDPRLRPDRSIAVDGGIDQTFARGRARASATWFYTRLQEIIIFDFSGVIAPGTDPFGRFGGYRNSRGGLARGFELEASGTLGRSFDLSGSYTHTNADQRVPVVAGVLQSFVVPAHQFSVAATGRITRNLMVNFDLVASSRYLAPVFDPGTFVSRAFEFDGLVKADVVASYRIPLSDVRGVRIYGKIENLFDRDHYESGFRTPGATALGGVKYEF